MRIRLEVVHDGLGDSPAVIGVEGRERLSEPFDLEVRIQTDDPNLPLQDLVWTEALLRVVDEEAPLDPPLRVFHGVIEQATYLFPRGDLFVYAVRLRPLVHRLAYRVRSRIFQAESAVAIARDILKDGSVPTEAVAWDLDEPAPREFCMQWKESELDFISRLLEDEGFYYWFEHSDDGHVLHVTDGSFEHEPIDGGGLLTVDDRAGAGFRADRVFDVTFSSEFSYDKFTTRDWNWEAPRGPSASTAGDETGLFESYEYPGSFVAASEAKRRAEDRLADLNAGAAVLSGSSSCPSLVPGRTFDLFGGHVDPAGESYLVVSTRHTFRATGTSPDGREGYEVVFTAVPVSTGFRPPLRTPRPRIVGKELAVVTGPPGEEIHVDKYGRVKVHFYWDREGPADDTASCWIRVQQQNTAGAMILPRIGWEVDVGFVDGDPDRPVILQKLYNKDTMPPYELPGNLMQSSLQTSSSPGGGGTNEIRLNDASGSQEFFVHAQKDFVLQVGNNFTEEITVDSLTDVTGSAKHGVTGNEEVTIGINQSANVVGRYILDVGQAKTIQVGATDTMGVTAMYAVTVGGARSDTVGGLRNVLASKMNETINGNENRTVGGVLSMNSAGPIVEAVAGNKVETVAGAKIELIAKAKAENIAIGKLLNAGAVTIKTGGPVGFAAEGAMGIKVGGPMVIQCSKDFNVSGATVTITVAEAEIKAGAKISLGGSGAKITGDKIASSGSAILLNGDIDYVAG